MSYEAVTSMIHRSEGRQGARPDGATIDHRECRRGDRVTDPAFLSGDSFTLPVLRCIEISQPMSQMGQPRHFKRASATSATPPIADVLLSRSERRSGPEAGIGARPKGAGNSPFSCALLQPLTKIAPALLCRPI